MRFGSDSRSVDLSRLNNSAPLLLNHDPDRQIGVIERAWIDDDKKGRPLFGSYSDLANEVFADVMDGIRELVSVSYVVNDWKHAKGEANEVLFARQVGCRPVSIVSIPADVTVGVQAISSTIVGNRRTYRKQYQNGKSRTKDRMREVPDQRAEKIAAPVATLTRRTKPSPLLLAENPSRNSRTNCSPSVANRTRRSKAEEVKLDRKERKQYSLLRAMRHWPTAVSTVSRKCPTMRQRSGKSLKVLSCRGTRLTAI